MVVNAGYGGTGTVRSTPYDAHFAARLPLGESGVRYYLLGSRANLPDYGVVAEPRIFVILLQGHLCHMINPYCYTHKKKGGLWKSSESNIYI